MTKADIIEALEPYPDTTQVFVRLTRPEDEDLWDTVEVEEDYLFEGNHPQVVVIVGG